MLDMVSNSCSFMYNLLENEELECELACLKHKPSVYALDYLVKEFQNLLDVTINSLDTRVIYDHDKFNVLFELAHSLNNLLDRFRERYISKHYNEK